MAILKITETELRDAVATELKTDDWPIDRQQDDRGLSETEYFNFARAICRKLGLVASE